MLPLLSLSHSLSLLHSFDLPLLSLFQNRVPDNPLHPWRSCDVGQSFGRQSLTLPLSLSSLIPLPVSDPLDPQSFQLLPFTGSLFWRSTAGTEERREPGTKMERLMQSERVRAGLVKARIGCRSKSRSGVGSSSKDGGKIEILCRFSLSSCCQHPLSCSFFRTSLPLTRRLSLSLSLSLGSSVRSNSTGIPASIHVCTTHRFPCAS